MEPDESRQQDPERLEKEEMSSTSSSALQISSPQREEDQQQEDYPCDPEKIFPEFKFLDLRFSNFLGSNSKVNIQNKYCRTIIQLFHSRKKSTNKSTKNTNFCLIKNRKHSYFLFVHPVQISTTTDITDFPSVNSLSDYPAFIQKWLKYGFKTQMNCCEKIEMFNDIMKSGSNVEEELGIDAVYPGDAMQRVIKHYHNEHVKAHKREESQYALAFIFGKNGEVKCFPAERPDFHNAKHSEELLIEKIDEFLQKNKTMEIEHILIYTYYSPCLKRPEQNICPCMILLSRKAIEWKDKYRITTYVLFTKIWGLCGPHLHKELMNSSIPCHGIDFQIEICKKIENSDNYEKLGDSVQIKRDKNELYNDIMSAVRDQKTKRDKEELYDDNVPSALGDHEPPDHLTGGIWETYTKENLKEITPALNIAALNLFVKDLKLHYGNNCPLRIYQLTES